MTTERDNPATRWGAGTAMLSYPADPRFAFHPYLPVRLGYLQLLRVLQPSLARLLRETDPFTLVSPRDRTTLYREGLRILDKQVPGDFVEIGVHRGGSAAILAELIKQNPARKLHLFDRWGDLPEPTEKDGTRREQYAKAQIGGKLAELRRNPPLEAARHVIEAIVGFPADRLEYYQGWYDTTLQLYRGGPIAIASIDCDYYESVKVALDFVEQHSVAGTSIILDDYRTWPGARIALHEWLGQTRMSVDLLMMPTGPIVVRLHGT